MKKILLMILGVIILFVLIVGSSIIGTYNNLISERQDARTAQGQIETQLQRRFDLVPNLVASVKGAMVQEQKVFDAIAQARTQYAGAQSGTSDKLVAGAQYDSAVSRLLVIMENYPELKSINTVQDLMVQLEGSENRISVARQRYNDSVNIYDKRLQTFPTNIIGGIFGFQQMNLFESVAAAQTAPAVNLNP
jgi:LemA protein